MEAVGCIIYHLSMRLRLIRHATLIVEYNSHTILVDPMLDDPGARPAIQNSPNPRNNPLVPLPVGAEEVVRGVDAVLVTHTHSDHWDAKAADLLPKAIPFFGQPEDETKFRSQAFSNVQAIHDSLTWKGITMHRTGGQHGTGKIGKAMAPVSGFVLQAQNEPTLYIAGDTIWCEEVQQALHKHRPDIVVVNTGAAQFLEGDPITMTADDVITTCKAAPNEQIVAVHMESINHCLLTRADLAFQLEAARVIQQVAIPNDGDWIELKAGKTIS
ncbi:MAG TPA: MBL fold metallo-hydrolase [Terriglobales bacterium]|jgi:L-ascorbate metabolism protein UlaG (beta-lactamase superfamily)|nr:MBL fold metallo-hydrolase [Terriglobales bacterium]